MRRIILLFTLHVVACGGDDDASNPPECTGSTCMCPAGDECDIGDSGCQGDSCSLDCSSENVCTGECGASCSIDCSGGSTCTVTVGPSGSVNCTDGSTCDVTCTAGCSVSCGGDSTCTLTCSGEDAQSIPEGGSCE